MREARPGADEPPRPPRRVPIRTLVGVAVLVTLVYAVFPAFADLRALGQELGRLDAAAVIGALGLALLGYALRGLRWHLFLRRLGVDSRPAPAALTYVSGFAMGITPGKLGELVRIYYARLYTGASYGVAISAAVTERALDVAAVALLFALGLQAVPHGGVLLALAVGLIVVVGLVVLARQGPAEAMFRFIARWRRMARLVERAREVHAGIRPLLRGRIFAIGSLLGLAAWSAEVLAVHLLARSIDIHLSLGAAAFVFMGASMAGVLSFLPGGLGATEGGMVALLLLLDVPLAPATALTIATRVTTLWFSMVVGAAAIALLRRREAGRTHWSSPAGPFVPRVDGLVMAALGLGALLLRWPIRSRYLYGWDSVSFALALEDYDVLAQRPHAPGYPLFAAVARVVHLFVAEANAALVATSILFSAAAVVFLYGLGREVASRRAALAASLIFMMAPIFVFNGVIALSYTSEAAASVGFAWLAWRVRKRPDVRHAAALGAAWALAIGLRQSLLFFLTPLALWASWPLLHRWRTSSRPLVAAAGAALIGGLAWFIPMVLATSGGLRGLRLATAIQGGLVVFQESVFVKGLGAVQGHALRVAFYLEAERHLLLPVVALTAAFTLAVAQRRWRAALGWPTGTTAFLAVWLLPSLLFYLFVFSGWDQGPTGYILVLLPGVYLIFTSFADAAARALEMRSSNRPPLRWAAVIIFALAIAWPVPALVEAQEPWLENEVRAHDEWSDRWNELREAYPPNRTALLTWHTWGHAKWYFSDYLVWGYFPVPRDAEPPEWTLFLETREHRDDVLYYEAHARGPGQPGHVVPEWVDTVVLLDFQFAGENGATRRLRPDVNVTEEHLDSGWRILTFRPDADGETIESYFTRSAAAEPASG